MTQTLRWTPQQLEEHLRRQHGPAQALSHPSMAAVQGKTRMQLLLDHQAGLKSWEHIRVGDFAPKGLALAPSPAPAPQPVTEGATEIPRRMAQRARAIASLDTATWSGSQVPGEHVEIIFHGVVLLSVNTLYGLTHYERVKYRKRWHDLVERAAAELLGPVQDRQPLGPCIVRAHRVSRRLADTDAKSGYLKYPIDGLRYSGVLRDDTPAQLCDLLCSQAVGPPTLALRIEAVDQHYVPVAMRDVWAQTMRDAFVPVPKRSKGPLRAL